jgi:asparagine synthase (glutamine-hydrolysing)
MCGIHGIVNVLQKINVDVINFESSLQLLSHRGPDDEGYVIVDSDDTVSSYSSSSTSQKLSLPNINTYQKKDPRVLFGHRRLSIIDLSIAGHQPMVSSDDNFIITFNGEIYNFSQIRDKLILNGMSFSTDTDTEVVLKSYIYWGEKCLLEFIGMFAFSIYDKVQGVVFIARDYFGIKPVYYSSKNGCVGFSSEIKSLIKLLGINPKLNKKQALLYFAKNIIDGCIETLFENIFELQSGHYIKITLNEGNTTLEQVKYWDYDEKINYNDFDEENAIRKLNILLTQSVDYHLVSDVPIGSLLSGGLDSSMIVNKLSMKLNKVKLFSFYDNNPNISEEKFVNLMIASLNSEVHLYTCGLNVELFNKDINEIVYLQDLPFLSLSIYSQYLLFKLAKSENITVVLDGQGSDEIFAGYDNYITAKLLDLFCSLNVFKVIKYSVTLIKKNSLKYLFRTYASAFEKFLFFKFPAINDFVTKQSMPKWLNVNYFKGINLSIDYKFNSKLSFLKNELLLTMKFTSLPQLLRYEDRNSMINSIESRVPFCNNLIAEFVFDLNDDLFISDTIEKKYMLKKAMESHLPEQIIYRKKVGFTTSHEDMLRPNAAKYIDLITNFNKKTNIFTKESISFICDQMSADNKLSNDVWKIISFILWYNTFQLQD